MARSYGVRLILSGLVFFSISAQALTTTQTESLEAYDSSLRKAYGMWANNEDRIYITEADEGRILNWYQGQVEVLKPEAVDDDLGSLSPAVGGGFVLVNSGDSQIVLLSASMQPEYGFSGSGSAEGSLNEPLSAVMSANQRIYVADTDNHRISVFNAQGLFLYSFGTNDDNGQSLNKPTHIFVDAQERVYVLEQAANRVSIYNYLGSLLQQFNSATINQWFDTQADITAFTVDQQGRLYLADSDSGQIVIRDWQQGQTLDRFGSFGQAAGQYRYIQQLAVSESGKLWVLDSKVAKLERYDLPFATSAEPSLRNRLINSAQVTYQCEKTYTFSAEQFLCLKDQDEKLYRQSLEGGGSSVFAAELEDPYDVHVSDRHVAILLRNKLYLYDKQGRQLFETGQYGSAPGSLDNARFVYTRGDRVYVADTNNNRVQVFDEKGIFRLQISGTDAQTGRALFEQVGPVAVDANGKVYVVDLGQALIAIFSAEGQFQGYFGDQTMLEAFKEVVDIDLDEQNRLYVLYHTETQENRVALFDNGQRQFVFGANTDSRFGMDEAERIQVWSAAKNTVFIDDPEAEQLLAFDYLERPQAAYQLSLKANQQQLELSWQQQNPGLISDYQIEVAAQQAGPYRALLLSDQTSKQIQREQQEDLWYRVVSISGSGLMADPSTAIRDDYQAARLVLSDNPQLSLKILDSLLQSQPANFDAMQLKGQAQMQLQDSAGAVATFKRLEASPKHRSLALELQVQALYQAGKFIEARGVIDEVLAQSPSSAGPYRLCAELSLKLADAITAVGCAEDGLRLADSDLSLRYLLAKAYWRAAIEDEALRQYQTVIKQTEANDPLRLQVADDLLAMERYQQALEQYQAIRQSNANNTAAAVGEAHSLIALGQLDRAKAIAVRLSAQNDFRAQGYLLLGQIALQQKQYTEAVIRLGRATKEAPEVEAAWVALAEAYQQQLQADKALEALQQGLLQNPQSFELQLQSGLLALQQTRYSEAIKHLRQALVLEPNALSARKALAQSLFALRQYAEAQAQAQQAAKLSNDDVELLVLQADIAAQQGQYGTAIEFLKTAIVLQPASAELLFRLGTVYANANLFDDAELNLQKAAAINPAWAEPHVALGQMYQKRRLFDRAIAAFEIALSLQPSDSNRALLNAAFAEQRNSLEFDRSGPQLQLVNLNLQQVFSAAYKNYIDEPIGRVTIRNVAGTDFGNLRLSFEIKEYMDFPWSTNIAQLGANSEQSVDIFATFNNRILQVDEDTGVQVEVKLSFLRDGQPDSINLTQAMTLYGKNAMVWSEPQMVASFVTPKDDALRDVVRPVSSELLPQAGPLNQQLLQAMTWFDALGAMGLRYVADPNLPYSSLRKDQVDYVQFPRETLRLKSGDCDDLSVLYSAGLENLGIETAMLEVPGHLLMMFNTGLEADVANLVSRNPERLAIVDGQVWIPVETTMVSTNFREAWAEGARKFQLALQQGNLGVIRLRQAWQEYRPVTLRQAEFQLAPPNPILAKQRIESDRQALLKSAIESLVLPYRSMMQSDPQNLQAQIQIVILYSRYGLFAEAEPLFARMLQTHPDNATVLTNYGNWQYMQQRYAEAAASYAKAASLEPKDMGIVLNQAMSAYQLQKTGDARRWFEQVQATDPELAAKHQAFANLLSN